MDSQEFKKIFSSPKPGQALKSWLAGGKDAPLFLNLADSIPAGPTKFHSGSVLDHLARCMDEVAGDPAAVWLAMAHDAGKLTSPQAMWPHHYAHEQRGEKITALWADQLGLDECHKQAAILTSRLHMKAGKYWLMRTGKKLAFIEEAETMPFQGAFWKVVNADSRSDIGDRIAEHVAMFRKGVKPTMSREDKIRLLQRLFA